MASCGSLLVTLGLILFSCHMLNLGLDRTVFFTGAVSIMTFTLTGLAVGLGALYPNFKEDNPSKIVSGFGGTFCLVLSFLYILASVILLALASPWTRDGLVSASRGWGCLLAFLALSWLLGWWPMRLSLRRVRQFEL